MNVEPSSLDPMRNWPVENLSVAMDKQEAATLQETYEQLKQRSAEFAARHPFPTQHNLIAALGINQALQDELAANANNTHPILHKSVATLISDFLTLKRTYGSAIEKQLYSTMGIEEFIDRLICKRPLAFLTSQDYFLLRDGSIGMGGFETIGTEEESALLCLRDYLSYDEMQISALMGMCIPTRFVNNGWRNNRGIPATSGTFIEKGIYYGLVGARFEKPGLMEWRHMAITPEQNKAELGYGIKSEKSHMVNPLLDIWARFYGVRHFPSFEEARADHSGKYIKVHDNLYLNRAVYFERLKRTLEPFLLDANEQAYRAGKQAYVHAVGIGLGAWLLTPEQGKIMVEVYKQIVSENTLSNIADIDFNWFPPGSEEGQPQSLKGIKLHFSKRNPAMPLPAADQDKLLIATYAWDGNSYPGNEYWLGSEYLAASGDPAAACCSNIVELQNPEINPAVSAKKVHFYGR